MRTVRGRCRSRYASDQIGTESLPITQNFQSNFPPNRFPLRSTERLQRSASTAISTLTEYLYTSSKFEDIVGDRFERLQTDRSGMWRSVSDLVKRIDCRQRNQRQHSTAFTLRTVSRWQNSATDGNSYWVRHCSDDRPLNSLFQLTMDGGEIVESSPMLTVILLQASTDA